MKPSYFDASVTYPILDIAMTNPFYAAAPHGSFCTDTMFFYYTSAAALAELGFIVVMVDGRGSIYRSKAFHDHAYGQVEKGSDLEDHVSFIKQLAKSRPYMDLERVGILDWGGSYGPIYGMLNHGDFYKVGAVTSIWDPRLVMQGTIYQGPDTDMASSAAGHNAENLEGPLLLIQGMLDNFFHPGGMFQVVDSLVKANKDFDLVMLPNGGHAWDTNRYGTRRMWDFLIKHLRGEEPPKNVVITNGTEKVFYGLPNS